MNTLDTSTERLRAVEPFTELDEDALAAVAAEFAPLEAGAEVAPPDEG